MKKINKEPEEELEIAIRKIKISHEDNRRTLKEVFNGDFQAKQTIIYEAKIDSQVGGHYHEYDELWAVLQGRIDYTFINVDTQQNKSFSLKTGETVRIPKRTHHVARIYQGTILLGFTEEKFVSEQANNKYLK